MERLVKLLSCKDYYSLEINYASKKTRINVMRLKKLNGVVVGDDWFNIFEFNGVVYIGLESRRIAYEEDKANGTNWVEKAIARGEYD